MRQLDWMGAVPLLCVSTLIQPALAQGVAPAHAPAEALIPAETVVLPNGLRLVMNVDHSDPVVAVALVAHVGSAREVAGRTGFAHMFEHLFFLNSENLGPGGLDRLSARIGGSGANGYTNLDHTVYLQTVPRDALEKILWAEADKLGFFINTVTPAVVAKEIEVVKNEKRQSYDNQPYGQLFPIAQAALYPADHPYSWTTIGSLADLSAATLDDVKEFYRRWYVPNNATLVISGDIDPVQTKAWVLKYFGEIPRGAPVAIPAVRGAMLAKTRRISHLDSFAKLPQVTMIWPSVADGAADDMATRIMVDALTRAPDGPVFRAVVEQAKISDAVEGDSWLQQMAGVAMLQVRGFDGVPLDRVVAAVDKGLGDFRREGVPAARLDRLKALGEAALYAQIGSVQGKVEAIAESETMRRQADYVDLQLTRLQALTSADVMRAFDQYIAGRPRLEVGFVPKDQPGLALSGAETARVVEEQIVQGAEKPVDQAAGRSGVQRTASSFDRSVEPPAGAPPVVESPKIWTANLSNGLALSGIEDRELPVVRFEIAIDGGQLRDDLAKPGAASLTAAMLTRGTRSKTREQFENALKALGAEITARVEDERTIIGGVTLSRNFTATVALVEEMITQPRWDAGELGLAKAAAAAGIQSARAQPSYLAEMIARQTLYADGVLSFDPRGTPESVEALTMADLQRFRAANYSPKAARLRVAGAVDRDTASAALASLAKRWTGPIPAAAGTVRFSRPDRTRVYFYDVPGAKQSAIIFAGPGPARGAADWFQARSANFILGGGGFAARLTQELREAKGYTYAVRSRFDGAETGGRLTVESPVRANVTLEAATLIRDIVRDYGRTYTDADLDLTKTSMQKARARELETLQAKLNLLGTIGDYRLPQDVVAQENAQLSALDKATVQQIAARYLDPDHMVVAIVGDAASQAGRLTALGYGEPVIVTTLHKAASGLPKGTPALPAGGASSGY